MVVERAFYTQSRWRKGTCYYFFCFCTVICLLSYLPLLALLSLFTLSLWDDTKWPTSVNVSQTNKTSGKPHFFTCLYFFLLFKFGFIARVCLFFGRLGAVRKHLAYWKRTKKKKKKKRKKKRFLKQCQNIDIALDNMVSEKYFSYFCLTLLLLNTTCPVLANSVDPDQLASDEANWSGSILFAINYVNIYQ